MRERTAEDYEITNGFLVEVDHQCSPHWAHATVTHSKYPLSVRKPAHTAICIETRDVCCCQA